MGFFPNMNVYLGRKRQIVLLKILISTAVLVLLVLLTDTEKMLSAMININLLVVLVSVALCFLQMILAGIRWYAIGLSLIHI